MSWFQTATGKPIDPFKITPEEIDILDIAHSLSLTCRYTGHCPRFYSVAQHSVLVAQNCKENPLWGLLHDAAEAYLVDLNRPTKINLREMGVTIFDECESNIMKVVCRKFNLPEKEPMEVRKADDLLLATEAKCFFGDTKNYKEWIHRPENGFEIIKPAIVVPWGPEESERQFLRAFLELT